MKHGTSPVEWDPVDSRRRLTISTAARELSATLVDLLAGLADISDGDGFWFRPLAAVSVELEFSIRQGTDLNLQAVRGACRDLLGLLVAAPRVKGFAARYLHARQSLPELQALHDQAQLDCRSTLGACSAEDVATQLPDPPCDFGAFVALRRGIARDESDTLIARWLASYEPRSPLAGVLSTEMRERSGEQQ